MDDQPETSESTDTSNNTEQLEFLQFLKSLDDVPQDIGCVSNDEDETFSEPEPQPPAGQLQLQPSGLAMDADLPIPHITITIPQGQFLGNELGSDQVIPEIRISFSNLPPATSAEIHQQLLPPTDRTKSELQQEHLALQQHHFVHKLYLATSSHQLTFLNWTGQGQQLRLDYIGLQDHLSGCSSMFSSHNVKQFIAHLRDIGFKRVATVQLEQHEQHPQLCFEHKNFKAGQPELLLQLATGKSRLPQMHPPQQRKPLAVDSVPRTMDPQSPLQMARYRFQMLLQYHNDVRLLMQQEPSVEQILPRRGRISSVRQPTQLLQPALAAKHVNPRDSVLTFEVGQMPEYAGFYGRAEPALISEFFAEYLPRYGSRVNGYKDIVVDASKANSFQQNLPIGVVYSDDEEELEELDVPIEETKIESPELTMNSVPEDDELEQVMQELCGIVPEAEQQLDKKNTRPKLKRKKSTRKGANVEEETELESSQEESTQELIQTLSAPITSPVKDEPKPKTAKNNCKGQETSKAEVGKQSKSEAEKESKSPKREVKRRRYDLRNSKSKRSN